MRTPLQWLFQRSLDDLRLKEHSDEVLLRQFIAGRDRASFDALLVRHGPMVLDVCQGMLTNEAEVEDAFQATFLILARKAGSVRKSGSLACWLHGVAYRVALRAQTAFARRRKHEARVPARQPATADDLTWREIRQVLHEELNRLAARVREPLILCYLQGMTQDQAAAELRLPKGTLKGRLERGRALLWARLTRRGLGASGVLVAGTLPALASSDLPDALLANTAQAAVNSDGNSTMGLVSTRADLLASGVARSVFIAKVKSAAVVLAACGLLISWLMLAGTGGAPAHAPTGPKVPADSPKTPRDDSSAKLKWQEGPDRIRQQTGPVFGLAFSPDGKKLAVAATKRRLNGEVFGEITVFDLATGRELTALAGYHPVAFSDDGKRMAYRYGDGGVLVADGNTYEQQALLKGLSDTVTCLAFRSDGRALVAGSGDPAKAQTPGMVRVWDLENGGERCTHTHPGAVCVVRFTADGKHAVSASSGIEGVVKTWDIRGNREVATTKGPGGRFFGGVALSPDGKIMATGIDPVGDTSEMDVKVWDLTTGKLVGPVHHHKEYTRGIAFSPDGKMILIGSSRRMPDESRTGVVQLWDIATGKVVTSLRGHNGEVDCVAFGHDGKAFASGAWDGSVKIWQLAADPVADDQWLKSDDEVLALHVSAFANTAKPGDTIEIVARLKNISNKPVNVFRPFGVPAIAIAAIEVRGPQGKLGRLGSPPPRYKVMPEAFVRLAPGESTRSSFHLYTGDFDGLQKAGKFTIVFSYSYKGIWDKEAEKGGLTRIWQGTIAHRGLPLEIRVDKDKERPKRLALDERLRSFLAHLERNRIKLEGTDDPIVWRIVEPKVAEGDVVVRILAIPITATDEQANVLREQLGQLPSVEKLEERMVVSGLRVRLAEDSMESDPKSAEANRLQTRFLELFRTYEPPKFRR